MPDAAISIVKSFQPYNAGDDFRLSHLWRLNKLWNIDKHRHIPAHGVLSNWQFRYCTEIPRPTPDQVDDCTIIRVALADKDKVEFNPELSCELRFIDEREQIDVGISDLAEMYDFVANTVIPAFAGFFPQSVVAGHTP